MNGKETLSYETMTEIRNSMDSSAVNMDENLNKAVEIINNLENSKIFKTDFASASMQESFAELAKNFAPFITILKEFSDFLTKELNVTYSETDIDLSDIWKSVKEAFDAAIMK